MSEETVRFSDAYKGTFNSVGQLTKLVDKELTIIDVEFYDTSMGEAAVAVVEVDGKTERRHTFSEVLVKQLHAIEGHLRRGKKVLAILRKRKRYYTFE